MVSQKQLRTQLRRELAKPGNNTCADCDSPGPTWASCNLGVFLCIRCAGCHRSLGTHLSRIRSTELDSWQPETVAFLCRVGNVRANRVWAASLQPHEKINAATPDSEAQRFITAKYALRRWIGSVEETPREQLQRMSTPSPTATSSSEPEESVFDFLGTGVTESTSNQGQQGHQDQQGNHNYQGESDNAVSPFDFLMSSTGPSSDTNSNSVVSEDASSDLFADMQTQTQPQTPMQAQPTAARSAAPLTLSERRALARQRHCASPWVRRETPVQQTVPVAPVQSAPVPDTSPTTHMEDLFASLTVSNNNSNNNNNNNNNNNTKSTTRTHPPVSQTAHTVIPAVAPAAAAAPVDPFAALLGGAELNNAPLDSSNIGSLGNGSTGGSRHANDFNGSSIGSSAFDFFGSASGSTSDTAATPFASAADTNTGGTASAFGFI
ncbi:MAG: hypothetical protein MHM6MM_004643 [Cercozoa sp. M6MM]